MGVTPVPIPNTMVKTQAADGTALETVWESRWLPEFEKREQSSPFYAADSMRHGEPLSDVNSSWGLLIGTSAMTSRRSSSELIP